MRAVGRGRSRDRGRAVTGLAARGHAALRLAAVFLALVACDSGDAGGPRDSGGERVAFPTPAETPADGITLDDFVGAEACGACHQERYREWRESTHGRAGGEPSPEVIIAPFDGSPMRFADATVVPTREAGRYRFVVRQDGWPEQVFTVDGVIGGGHMVGGGTQGYVARWPDGTVRFLPFDWSRSAGAWFCNTGTRLDHGWVPITAEMRLADCGDWPPPRILGHDDRFANCQECHGSQIRVRFDRGQDRWVTDYTSLRINCESCHGPGRDHAERMAAAGSDTAGSAAAGGGGDIGLASLSTLGTDASLEVCFRCHALKDALRDGYLPGDDFDSHYAVGLPILGDRPYHADGRVRTFAYQATHLYSACYWAGSMTCTDCHAPHDQAYRDAFGTPLVGRFDDRQCTACHPSKAGDDAVRRHTRHAPGSEGARCVACHMPFLQHPDVADAGIPFARSDHTIPVPRPAFDAALGIETACGQCHADMTVAEQQAVADEWWGELKPHAPAVARRVAADSALVDASLEEAAALLLEPTDGPAIARLDALGTFIERVLEPDAGALPHAVDGRLRALSDDPDLGVRALALAALHLAAGEDGDTRAFLASRLREAAPRDAALRGRWFLVLGYLGDAYRADGRPEAAVLAYQKALEVRPGDAHTLMNLGLAHQQAGRPVEAVAVMRRALETDPGVPLGFVNLGIALQQTGDAANARVAFERAAEVNPYEPLAYYNLGNLYLRAERPADAVPHYRRAVELDPGLARAHYNLARALIVTGRYDEALPAARRALEFGPELTAVEQMVRDLETAVAAPGG